MREHVQDDTYKHCSEIVNCLEKKGNQDALWHRQCYTDFTNKGHIQRLQKRVSDREKADKTVGEGTFLRRSSLERMDWTKCILCQTDPKRVALSQVQTFDTSEKVLNNVVNDKEMSCRLARISDLIAAQGKYHLKCYTRYLKKTTQKISEDDQDANVTSFKEVMAFLETRLSEGHIYSLKAVWTYYSKKLEQKYHL